MGAGIAYVQKCDLALVTVIAGVAGCARPTPLGPGSSRPADPMVLIPAGTFTMGDSRRAP